MLLAIPGGSGSLGRAILRQQDLLHELGITRIRILSRDSQKHVEILRSYKGPIQLDCFQADVTDKERMKFALRDAHFCIHAAADKHVDRFELDVPVGYAVNILGTQHVADAFMLSPNAIAGTFVSTDKAADPCTAYGASKLAAEYSWLWHLKYQKKIRMKVCRYGNVFGSKGSVIKVWKDKVMQGEPIPLTDKTCTRFFISVSEAAKFVLNSLRAQEEALLIPAMKSIEMIKLAEFIWKKHYVAPFKFVLNGLRENEKIHEVLRTGGPSSFDAERLNEDELKELYLEWQKLEHV